MDPIARLAGRAPDWRTTITGLAAELGTSRMAVYRYMASTGIEPDIQHGPRRFFSRTQALRFAKRWLGRVTS